MDGIKATLDFLGALMRFLCPELSDMGDRTLVTMWYVIIKKRRTHKSF